MALRITLALIALLGVVMVAFVWFGHVSVGVELPAGAEPPHPAWLFGWLFILFSAAIIVSVTAVNFAVRLARKIWRKR